MAKEQHKWSQGGRRTKRSKAFGMSLLTDVEREHGLVGVGAAWPLPLTIDGKPNFQDAFSSPLSSKQVDAHNKQVRAVFSGEARDGNRGAGWTKPTPASKKAKRRAKKRRTR